ncbi:MAG: NUDIX domain-containing protein [Chlamydiota bacterium]
MKTLHVESFGIIPLAQSQGIWKVLLILHKEGSHWSFPKGRKNEKNETHIEAALRELKEETGLDVQQLLQDTPLLESYTFRRQGTIIQKTVHYYPAIVTGELNLQEEEIRDACWLTLDEAMAKLTFKEARSLCRHAMKSLPA